MTEGAVAGEGVLGIGVVAIGRVASLLSTGVVEDVCIRLVRTVLVVVLVAGDEDEDDALLVVELAVAELELFAIAA